MIKKSCEIMEVQKVEEPKDGHETVGKGEKASGCCSFLHNAPGLVFSLCLCSLAQGLMLNAVVPNSVSTLEKRYHLTSLLSGMYISTYELGVLVCLIPVTYIGGKGDKPKWIASGMLIFGLGSFTCTLGHFISPPYHAANGQDQQEQLCVAQGQGGATESHLELHLDLEHAVEGNKPQYGYFSLLVIGQLLHGIGTTPIYTLAVTYLDENVDPAHSALYLAFFYGASLLGPVIGFMSTFLTLQIPGDTFKMDAHLLPEINDSNFYGAWWIMFLVNAIFAIMVSIIIFTFPKTLASAPKRESHSSDVQVPTSFAELFKSIKVLLKCRAFVFLIAIDSLEGFLGNGVLNFLPKILENFFTLSASSAALAAGAALVPAALFGNLLGGGLIKCFNMKVAPMLLMALGFDCVRFLFLPGFLLHCPSSNVVGVNQPYPLYSNASGIQLTAQCNSHCNCTSETYKPICNYNHSFYSPCYAGCQMESGGSWSDCLCAQPGTRDMTDGLCDSDCTYFYPFIFLLATYIFLAFCTSIPIQQAELRLLVVPFLERSLATGLRWVSIRIFGTLPAPLLFGLFIDKTCISWRKTKKDVRLDCALYDNSQLAVIVIIMGAIVIGIVLICLFFAWRATRQQHSFTTAIQQSDGTVSVTPTQITFIDESLQDEEGPICSLPN